jgi:hypothetical protein
MTCPHLDAQVTGYLPPGSQLAGARRPLECQVQVTNPGACPGCLGGEQTCACKAVGPLEKGKKRYCPFPLAVAFTLLTLVNIKLFFIRQKKMFPNAPMAGLRTNDQKNAIAVTMTIVTAFKICISHRKNGLLNRLPAKVSFSIF